MLCPCFAQVLPSPEYSHLTLTGELFVQVCVAPLPVEINIWTGPFRLLGACAHTGGGVGGVAGVKSTLDKRLRKSVYLFSKDCFVALWAAFLVTWWFQWCLWVWWVTQWAQWEQLLFMQETIEWSRERCFIGRNAFTFLTCHLLQIVSVFIPQGCFIFTL